MRIWDRYLSDRDRAVYETAGYGAGMPLGGRPALLVIDVNYDFVGHEPAPILDSIRTWPNSCGEAAWQALPAIESLLATSRQHRVPIFYTTSFAPQAGGLGAGLWRTSRLGEHPGVPGYVGSDIVAQVAPTDTDTVIRKSKPSAFFGTRLLSLLLELRIDTLLVAGTTTSGCVRATVVDAFSYNFTVAVVEEATFDRGEVCHAVNLFEMDAKYAEVISLSEALDYIARPKDGIGADPPLARSLGQGGNA